MKWFFCWCQATDFRDDHNWKDLIRASVISARQNTTLEPYLIYDGEETEFIDEIRGYGVTIIFHKITFNKEVIDHQPENFGYQVIARGAFLRFEIPILCDSPDDYVLYTDADVLFLKDPDFSGFKPELIAAAPQFDRGKKVDMNSGVMLINLQKFKEIYNELIEFTKNNLDVGLDQEILRVFIGNNYMLLPDHFNWKPYWGVNPEATILHWHGPKPEVIKQLRSQKINATHQSWTPLLEKNPEAYDYYVEKYSNFIENRFDKNINKLNKIDTNGKIIDRKSFILQHINKSDIIIEIGPNYNPLVPKSEGWSTTVVDHSNRDELLTSYHSHGVNLENIEQVDVVWNGNALHENFDEKSYNTFDVIIISHVLEHLPDPIQFFNSCRKLLKENGKIIIAVPDKRYCFDFFEQITCSGDWIYAFDNKSLRHSPLTAYNSIAYAAKRGNSIAWSSDNDEGIIDFVHTLEQAMGAFQNAKEHPSTYIDFHTWRFLPSSIKFLFDELAYLGFIDFHINNINSVSNEIILDLCPSIDRKKIKNDFQSKRLEHIRNIFAEMSGQFNAFFRSEERRIRERAIDELVKKESKNSVAFEIKKAKIEIKDKYGSQIEYKEVQLRHPLISAAKSKEFYGTETKKHGYVIDLLEILGVYGIEFFWKIINSEEDLIGDSFLIEVSMTDDNYIIIHKEEKLDKSKETTNRLCKVLLNIPMPARFIKIIYDGKGIVDIENLIIVSEAFFGRTQDKISFTHT
ncbi:MAG: methyltransferase domain-containing protein [Acidiphilium sp.]|nr:methyltransferase domain-containing protein [Acidiphilium sp.]MDD4935793.1 methyltransferase domain-containing protein [Acidiphilium sp.]